MPTTALLRRLERAEEVMARRLYMARRAPTRLDEEFEFERIFSLIEGLIEMGELDFPATPCERNNLEDGLCDACVTWQDFSDKPESGPWSSEYTCAIVTEVAPILHARRAEADTRAAASSALHAPQASSN